MQILRNLVAVVLGLLLGSAVNMALVYLGNEVVSPPPGADLTTAEGLREALPMLKPVHFLFPFMAHALGTLSGAWLAARISKVRRAGMAMLIGLFFFAGGVAAAFMIPAPTWFIATDLALAYFPMAWIGARLSRKPAR